MSEICCSVCGLGPLVDGPIDSPLFNCAEVCGWCVWERDTSTSSPLVPKGAFHRKELYEALDEALVMANDFAGEIAHKEKGLDTFIAHVKQYLKEK